MTMSHILRTFLVAVISTYVVEAFLAGAHPPRSPLTRSFVRPDSTSLPTKKTSVRSGETAATRAPRMSSYEGGPSSSGGGETRMEMQELIVDFTDDGRILLEVKGVKGQECRQLTEELIKSLGDVITTENTAEYFEEKVVNVQKDALKVGWSYDANKPEW